MDKIIKINIANFAINISKFFNIEYKELIQLFNYNKKYIVKQKPKKMTFKNIEMEIYEDKYKVKYLVLAPKINNVFYALKIIDNKFDI